jgi:glycosyltransferase involved in cell wall biosynthesis
VTEADPQATFLMSTFNAGSFLRHAIESVLAQTDARWRLVVVDDGSEDGSAEVVSEYDDPRITLVALERNVGQTAALNLGLDLIETPWVARLDQDDMAAPDRLECQLAYLDAHPGTVLLGSWADFIDERGKTIGRWRPAASPDQVRRGLYVRPCPLVHSAVIYRADVARSLGGYPIDFVYAQDLALWVAMDAVGTVAIVPRVLTYLRRHAQQASRDPAAAALQIGEALATTQTLPAELAGDRATRRAWRARRLRLTAERVVVATRARDKGLARRSALDALRLLAADPLALLAIAGLGARSAYRKAAGRISLGLGA